MAANPTFFDNFNSLSLWNGTSGTWNTNYWYNALNGNGGSLPSNGEQEWYINSNDPATSSIVPWTSKNGIMTITGSQTPSGMASQVNNYQYVSGELNTYHSFSQTYGYFEMRGELPAGQGLWPAFWMIPENGSWPPEIDVMEVLGNSPTTLYTSLHSGTASNEINSGGNPTVADTSTAYHEYAVDWTPSTITFYYDGKAVWSHATPAGMDVPMYMEVNLAMGGYWPGNIDSTTPLPAQMHVANVTAYASNPNGNLATNTYTANNTPGQVIIGASGNDVFNAGTNSVIMTGQGLTNTYVWTALPTATPHITDFDPGVDKVDIGGLLHSVGYSGSNPFGDGTLSLASDGHGGTDLNYKAANGAVTTIVDFDNVQSSALDTGGADFITGYMGSGQNLVADNTPGQILTATTPNDTFQAGQNSVIMTEDGGSNTFIWTALPWNLGQITNFNPASDKIDVSAVLKSAGYTGTNPFGDGTLSLTSDGHGGSYLMYNPPGAGSNGIWSTSVVDIDNVAASSLHTASDFVTSTSSGGGGTLGVYLTADGTAGQLLTATTPNDTFIAGQNSVVMTQDGGSNDFIFQSLPSNAGHITNFNPASDTIDLSGILHNAGYTGTSPFSDGTLHLKPDGHGGTDLVYTGAGAGTPTTVVDIDHLAPTALHVKTDFIVATTQTADGTAGQVLSASTPNDTFVAGQNSVVMTEDGGTNNFVFMVLPQSAGHITDFNTASDRIDIRDILHNAGYTGAKPFADGTLSLTSDGQGGTNLMYNPLGSSAIKIVDLDHVALSSINKGTDFITH